MAKLFKLKVNTPAGIFFEDDIIQIELRTPSGVIGVLADHQPVIGSILPSLCWIKDSKGNRVSALVNTGIFETDGKSINIITDFFDFTNKINDSVLEIRKQKIAEAIKSAESTTNVKLYEGIQRKLEKELEDLNKLTKK
ncbi:MAG: F0F1 ATP synthase subunit epsilon [Mycoplasmataceae bacterium]|nr:F0F1 ATP synthase subunit epsilon [Mycoplasmataceae bacterium]